MRLKLSRDVQESQRKWRWRMTLQGGGWGRLEVFCRVIDLGLNLLTGQQRMKDWGG